MRKRLAVGLVASGMLVATLPGMASAGPPVGGCPTGATNVPVVEPQYGGWHLEPLWALAGQDVGNQLDQNEDGYICHRFVIGLTKKDARDNPNDPIGVWVVKDNTHKAD